jgi:hypothetical protein
VVEDRGGEGKGYQISAVRTVGIELERVFLFLLKRVSRRIRRGS